MKSFFALLLISIGATTAMADPPNILFILADDQRTDTIGAHGNPNINTPSIDSLVRGGFSFKRNYCMGSMHGAVCQPSRAMMMTGQAYFRLEMDMKGTTTFPQRLQEHGYTTFATGKWHNNPTALLKSFQQGKAVMMGGMSNHEEVPIVDISPGGRLINRRTGEKLSSELFADGAIEFFEQHDMSTPFMAYVALTSPHDPRQPPLKYRQPYYDANLPLPKNFLPQHPFDNGRLIVRDENLGAWPRTEEVVRDQLAEYYGMITHMDTQIGRILKKLDETGVRDNTIIVYAADHGLAVGSHGLLGKQNLYEHSMGAPLIFSGPGIPKGKSSTALTYLYDIFPTVFDHADIKFKEDIDGVSLKPLWTKKKKLVRDSIFLAYEDLQRALVEERWKLILYPKIGHTQLFDLKNDPDEMNDLAGQSKYSKRIERMMKDLEKWKSNVGDRARLKVARPLPKEIDLTGTPRKADHWQPDWIIEKYFEADEQ
jgi:arylsulfatase A-like enzyme